MEIIKGYDRVVGEVISYSPEKIVSDYKLWKLDSKHLLAIKIDLFYSNEESTESEKDFDSFLINDCDFKLLECSYDPDCFFYRAIKYCSYEEGVKLIHILNKRLVDLGIDLESYPFDVEFSVMCPNCNFMKISNLDNYCGSCGHKVPDEIKVFRASEFLKLWNKYNPELKEV